jgi:hypothetical protein
MVDRTREKLRVANDCIDDAINEYQVEIDRLRNLKKNLFATQNVAERLIPKLSNVVATRYIRSSSKAINYFIRLHENRLDDSCECPDFKHRRRACKHIQEARADYERSVGRNRPFKFGY